MQKGAQKTSNIQTRTFNIQWSGRGEGTGTEGRKRVWVRTKFLNRWRFGLCAKSGLPGIRIECHSESGADALGELAVGVVNLQEIARGSGDSGRYIWKVLIRQGAAYLIPRSALAPAEPLGWRARPPYRGWVISCSVVPRAAKMVPGPHKGCGGPVWPGRLGTRAGRKLKPPHSLPESITCRRRCLNHQDPDAGCGRQGGSGKRSLLDCL